MWRRIKFVLAGVFSLITLAAIAGAAYQYLATQRDLSAVPPPGRLVDIGGHRLYLWCEGTGSPTVVLDSGVGSDAFSWPRVKLVFPL